MEERFRRSALWIEARHGADSASQTDDEAFAQILRNLKDAALRISPFPHGSSNLLRTVPRIEISFGEQARGNKLTCDFCAVTLLASDPDKFVEFIVLHAGCEVCERGVMGTRSIRQVSPRLSAGLVVCAGRQSQAALVVPVSAPEKRAE